MDFPIQPAAWEYITRQPPFNTRPNGLLEDVYLFVYTHHLRPSEFLQKYPGAQFIGGAWLKGWKWFLTGCRVPNIRPIIQGDNKVGTPGYVFRVSCDIEYAYYNSFKNYHNFPTDKFNCIYDNHRIRSAQKVIITTNNSKPMAGAKPIRAITYWDATGKEPLENVRSRGMTTIEKKRWMRGLKSLEQHAFPGWVMQHCYEELWRSDLQEKRKKVEARGSDASLTLRMACAQRKAIVEEHARKRQKTTYQPTMACLPRMSLMSLPKIEAARAVHDRIDASLAKLHNMDLVRQPAVRPPTKISQRVDSAFEKLSNLKPAAPQQSVRVLAHSAKKVAGSTLQSHCQPATGQRNPINPHHLPVTECSGNGQAALNFYLKEKELKAKRTTAKNLRVLQLQAGA